MVRLLVPLMVPPTVRLLLATFTCAFGPSVTAPVPVFSGLLPTNVKLLRVNGLLPLSVMAVPLVLSRLPPERVNARRRGRRRSQIEQAAVDRHRAAA